MNIKALLFAVLFTTLVGCGSDRDGTPLVQGSNGVASLSGEAVVGGTLSASISDPDDVQPDAVHILHLRLHVRERRDRRGTIVREQGISPVDSGQEFSRIRPDRAVDRARHRTGCVTDSGFSRW